MLKEGQPHRNYYGSGKYLETTIKSHTNNPNKRHSTNFHILLVVRIVITAGKTQGILVILHMELSTSNGIFVLPKTKNLPCT